MRRPLRRIPSFSASLRFSPCLLPPPERRSGSSLRMSGENPFPLPISPLRLTTILFIKTMLKREQWRFSHYRKCYKEKLERVTIPLPVTASGAVDEDAIEAIVELTPYAAFLKERLKC